MSISCHAKLYLSVRFCSDPVNLWDSRLPLRGNQWAFSTAPSDLKSTHTMDWMTLPSVNQTERSQATTLKQGLLNDCTRFEVLTVVKISMVFLWVVETCALVSSYRTDNLEEHTASVFNPEDVLIYSFKTLVLTHKFSGNRNSVEHHRHRNYCFIKMVT